MISIKPANHWVDHWTQCSLISQYSSVIIIPTPLSTLNARIEYALLSCFSTGRCDRINSRNSAPPAMALSEIRVHFGTLFICVIRRHCEVLFHLSMRDCSQPLGCGCIDYYVNESIDKVGFFCQMADCVIRVH